MVRPPAPSGRQLELHEPAGGQRAVITEVGATLREYEAGGEPVVDGFGEASLCDSGRGQILVPWPNRLEDGRYRFGSSSAEAALDEPERANAIHGLARWQRWTVARHGTAAARLELDLPPQPGYPFRLGLAVEYSLAPGGLSVTLEAQNLAGPAGGPLPFGAGFHPYLRPGPGALEQWTLLLPATRWIETDARGLPVPGPYRDLGGTSLDFRPRAGRGARAIGATVLDTCFTGIEGGDDGRTRVELDDPSSGRGVTMWAGGGFGYLMVFTGDTVADPLRRRAAVAIEPMTCPPNALRSGADLIVLEPGQAWSGSWGLEPRLPAPGRAVPPGAPPHPPGGGALRV